MPIGYIIILVSVDQVQEFLKSNNSIKMMK